MFPIFKGWRLKWERVSPGKRPGGSGNPRQESRKALIVKQVAFQSQGGKGWDQSYIAFSSWFIGKYELLICGSEQNIEFQRSWRTLISSKSTGEHKRDRSTRKLNISYFFCLKLVSRNRYKLRRGAGREDQWGSPIPSFTIRQLLFATVHKYIRVVLCSSINQTRH